MRLGDEYIIYLHFNPVSKTNSWTLKQTLVSRGSRLTNYMAWNSIRHNTWFHVDVMQTTGGTGVRINPTIASHNLYVIMETNETRAGWVNLLAINGGTTITNRTCLLGGVEARSVSCAHNLPPPRYMKS